MPNWDYYDRDQAIDEAIRLQREIDNHECDHSDCIAKSSLPPLPAGWHGPWEAKSQGYVSGMLEGRRICFAACEDRDVQFLADLLNVTHPSPRKEGE